MGFISDRVQIEGRETKIKEIEDLKLAILSLCQPKQLILFGSALSEFWSRGSDIDLALIFESQVDLECAKNKLRQKALTQNRSYDLLFYTENEFLEKSCTGGVCQIIREQGRVIYES